MKIKHLELTLLTLALASCSYQGQPKSLDPAAASSAFEGIGTYNAKAGVFHVEVPRAALKISIGGQLVATGPIQSWASFGGTRDDAMVIGSIPVEEDEINPVALAILSEPGLQVTAIHNALLSDSPRTFSIHFEGKGRSDALFRATADLFRETAPLMRDPHPLHAGAGASRATFDLGPIQQYLWKGDYVNGAYVIRTGRGTEISGLEIGKAMGADSWLAFSGTDKEAFVNGDIAMLDREMKRVMLKLIGSGFKLVSVHTHMTGEVPRLLFAHILGSGPLETLAANLKSALREEKVFRGSQ